VRKGKRRRRGSRRIGEGEDGGREKETKWNSDLRKGREGDEIVEGGGREESGEWSQEGKEDGGREERKRKSCRRRGRKGDEEGKEFVKEKMEEEEKSRIIR
jgi:hypothetical protein